MSEQITTFKPSKKQIQFLRSDRKYLCYGGARGGGKSWIVRLDACMRSQRYAGHKALIVRLSYPELDGNHIQPLCAMLNGIARYNKSEKRFVFPNGSTIKLDYCGSDSDVTHFQGQEYDAIYIDESTNLKWEWIEKIIVCNRGHNDFPHVVRLTANPGGRSHAEHKARFVDRRFKPNENPQDFQFIKALVTDNRALMDSDPYYIKVLQNLPPKLRTAWLQGDWNIFEGMYFEDFRTEPDMKAAYDAGVTESEEDLKKQHRWVHVIPAFDVPKSWQLYRSFDWGYHHPFSMGYYAVNYDGVIFRIAQFYGVQYSAGDVLPNEGLKWSPDRVFAQCQRYEQEMWPGRNIKGVADPAIWDAESGISYAETAAKYGLFFTKGDHARIPGWMQCHYRLQFDAEGYAQFYVFDSCKEFIRTIPTLQYDDHKVEDIDTDGQDHIADEWRYMLMTRPIKPVIIEEKPKPKYGADPLDQFGNSYRRR